MTTTYTTYAYGHDYGNSETCGTVWMNGERSVLTMPSALWDGSHEELQSRVSASSSSTSLGPGFSNSRAHTLQVKGLHKFVGHLAIDQAPKSLPLAELTSRGDVSRYWSDRNLVLLLATSATLIKDSEYGLAVVTNLPIATHTDENARAVKAALDGDHTFSLDGVKRIAHVCVKKTLMEAAGANISCGASVNEKIAIIDIGGRTVDAYMVRGQIPLLDQCDSLDVGVETAADALTHAFEQRFRFPLSILDAQALLRHFVHEKRYDLVPTILNADADPALVEEMIEKQLRETGSKIAAFLKRRWSSSLKTDVVASDVLKVVLIGGGAYYFSEDLRPLFKKRLFSPGHPEYANALGYATLAQYYLQREMNSLAS